MLSIVLWLHNVLRWLVVVAGVAVLALEYVGWLGKHEWKPTNKILGMIFTSALDVQMLLGIILMFVLGFGNLGFFLSMHIPEMFIAIVLAHVGSQLAKRGATDVAKHRRAAIWYTIAILLILMFIPWQRPLLPGM